jgi:anti-anti-sigma factor
LSSTLLASPARRIGGRADAADSTFTSQVVLEHDVCVVRVAGELDSSSAALAMRTCLDVGRRVVSVDLRELTFMDCGGYRGLVGARVELERSGGSLTITGAVGEPARLLELLGVT